MALDCSIIEQFKNTLSVAPSTGADGSGDPTYGAPVVIRARVEQRRESVEVAPGTFRQTSHKIATDGALVSDTTTMITIGPKDRIWLEGVDNSDATLARTPAALKDGVNEVGETDFQELNI